MRGSDIDVSGKKQSGSWHAILVVAPCPLSDKLSSPSLLMAQSLGFLEWGTVMRDWPFCQGQIRILNAMLGFCREAFHVGQTEMTLSGVNFCSRYTISTAKRKDNRDSCSHFLYI
jgi:hypothetical protein